MKYSGETYAKALNALAALRATLPEKEWPTVDFVAAAICEKADRDTQPDHIGDVTAMVAQPDNEPLCKDDETFIQTKYGYCFYTIGPRPLIYNLYVHPQYRGRGYSKALLEIAMCEIWKGEYKGEIRIQAEPREGSISRDDLMEYYARMGLVVCDRRKPEPEGGASSGQDNP